MDKSQYAPIVRLLQEQIGFKPESLGPVVIKSAIDQVLSKSKLRSVQELIDEIPKSSKLWQSLVGEITVQESWFFRYPASFDHLKQSLVGDLSQLRLLSLGCSTGEEPYSVAMTLFEAGLRADHFLIEAVDIDPRALAHARTGLYTDPSFRAQDLSFRDRWFNPQGDAFCVTSALRHTVHFIESNVMEEEFWKSRIRYRVIFCRNLLIYLHDKAKRQLLERIKSHLHPEGLLFLGPTDAIEAINVGMVSVGDPRAFAFGLSSGVLAKPIPEVSKSPIIESTLEDIRALADAGMLEEARQRCEKLRKRYEKNPEFHYFFGVVSHAEGKCEEAAEHFNRAVYLDPLHHRALVYLVLLAENRGDLELAERLRLRANAGVGA